MKIGIYLNAQHPETDDPRRKFDEMIEQVRFARALGFDSLWGGEHHATPGYHYFPLLGTLQRLAAEAEGMTIGTNIVLLPLHNPVEIAEQGAYLDVLSDGRFMLGVGLGYRQQEFDIFGVPLQQRVSRFVESIEVIRRLWCEDHVTHNGRHWQFEDVTIRPRPMQASPPVLVGAQVEASIARAAAIGDGWCMVPSATVGEITQQIEMYLCARRAAEKPGLGHLVRLFEVVCARDPETALRRAAPHLLAKYVSYAQWGLEGVRFDSAESPEVQLKRLAANRFAVGAPSDIVDAFMIQHQLGVTHVTMRVGWPGMPQASILESLELIGTTVLAEVRQRIAAAQAS
ncbi:MAG: LLM class flavin-dependent oxidoreductase [Hyphomicrobiaceae bacterium]